MDDYTLTVRLDDGVAELWSQNPIEINPPTSAPARAAGGRDRYVVSLDTIGQIERLARARYDLGKLKEFREEWPELVSPANAIIAPLAQSVWASTAIEGEEIHESHVEIAISGHGEAHNPDLADYESRKRLTAEIYKAYVWALTRPFPLEGGKAMTCNFILELHKRMFGWSKPEMAGSFKNRENAIRYQGRFALKMPPPNRTRELLDAACSRLNHGFELSKNHGSVSLLLTIGEFVVDFLAIHPFIDGNGRMARLLSTLLLERAGFHFARFYPLDRVILDRRARYYEALFRSQRAWLLPDEDISPWIRFYVDAIFEQWLRAHREIQHASAK